MERKNGKKKWIVIICTGILACVMVACGNTTANELVYEEQEEKNLENYAAKDYIDEEHVGQLEDWELENQAEVSKTTLWVEDGKIEKEKLCVFGERQLDNTPESEKMVWVILAKEDNKIFVISRYLLPQAKAFNEAWNTYTTATWDNCSLRTWLNGEFMTETFNGEQQSAILYTQLDNTSDKIFCLSSSEVTNYLNGFKMEYRRGTFYQKDTSYRWWLRTTGETDLDKTNKYTMCFDGTDGVVKREGSVNYTEQAVRPAMWIDLDMVSVEKWEMDNQMELASGSTSQGMSTSESDHQIESVSGGTSQGVLASEVVELEAIEGISVGEVGETVLFGEYEQDNDINNGKESIEWVILDKNVEEGRVLLLSRNILDFHSFNSEMTYVTWEVSEIRNWLNDSFFKTAFTLGEQKQLCEMVIETDDGINSVDTVFFLSKSEINQYLEEVGNDALISQYTPYLENQNIYTNIDGWWTRSDGKLDTYKAVVSRDGDIPLYGQNQTLECGVRPAIWVMIK